MVVGDGGSVVAVVVVVGAGWVVAVEVIVGWVVDVGATGSATVSEQAPRPRAKAATAISERRSISPA